MGGQTGAVAAHDGALSAEDAERFAALIIPSWERDEGLGAAQSDPERGPAVATAVAPDGDEASAKAARLAEAGPEPAVQVSPVVPIEATALDTPAAEDDAVSPATDTQTTIANEVVATVARVSGGREATTSGPTTSSGTSRVSGDDPIELPMNGTGAGAVLKLLAAAAAMAGVLLGGRALLRSNDDGTEAQSPPLAEPHRGAEATTPTSLAATASPPSVTAPPSKEEGAPIAPHEGTAPMASSGAIHAQESAPAGGSPTAAAAAPSASITSAAPGAGTTAMPKATAEPSVAQRPAPTATTTAAAKPATASKPAPASKPPAAVAPKPSPPKQSATPKQGSTPSSGGSKGTGGIIRDAPF
ncbi:hypothetical protein [Chondromyces crocatus]|uniref:Uncharacterized protein n=1 Tax=Chondromyces crocatus TaxID=52 RepID=A0A0K1EJL9_CHOCO|nr:hypothetical protein [Chondromyces crocatus]AKT40877.1 uncharacterized protein CMC5_050340 [Chondromyces crocatus]